MLALHESGGLRMRWALLVLLFVLPSGVVAADPPAISGYDARLRIPVCGPGELLRWQPAAGGWHCDGSALASVRQTYTDAVRRLVDDAMALPVPAVPECDASLPNVCAPPPVTPHCDAHPEDPACGSKPPVETEGCGCVAQWAAFTQWRIGGGESSDAVEVPVEAGSTTIPHGRTLYYRVEGQSIDSENGSDFHGWSALACRNGQFVPYESYPMALAWAWELKWDALPMAYNATAGGWEQPFSVRSACQ